jgi:hypothetical protein
MYSKNELQEKINKDLINVMLSNIEINQYDLSLMQDQTHHMFWWLLSHVLLCVCVCVCGCWNTQLMKLRSILQGNKTPSSPNLVFHIGKDNVNDITFYTIQ